MFASAPTAVLETPTAAGGSARDAKLRSDTGKSREADGRCALGLTRTSLSRDALNACRRDIPLFCPVPGIAMLLDGRGRLALSKDRLSCCTAARDSAVTILSCKIEKSAIRLYASRTMSRRELWQMRNRYEMCSTVWRSDARKNLLGSWSWAPRLDPSNRQTAAHHEAPALVICPFVERSPTGMLVLSSCLQQTLAAFNSKPTMLLSSCRSCNRRDCYGTREDFQSCARLASLLASSPKGYRGN